MDIVVKLSQFLLSLSLLIILHELGHFIPAKLFKTRVEKFYLFFDVKFSLVKKKIGETVYGIGWLPLGGYVKISGMIDESMDKEQMALPPQPWEFRSKPAWQRLIIMLGGVTVNFVLAFLIYIGMAFVYGDFYVKNENIKDGLWVMNPVLEKAGLKTGDKIVSIDGKPFDRVDGGLSESVVMSKSITIERDGQQQTVKMPVNLIDQMQNSGSRETVRLRMPFVVGGFAEDSKNKTILEAGDILTSVDGKPIRYYDQLTPMLANYKNKTVPATVIRKEKETAVNLVVNKEGKIGVGPGAIEERNMERLGYYKFNRETYGFFESFPVGIARGKDRLASYWNQLKAIVNPETGAIKSVGGFYAIFNIFPSEWVWENFWNITAILSIMLGVMNLLPIPALDGGHVMFLLYEMITRRKPSDKFMEYAQMAGFILLIGLILFANGNDIYKAIVSK
ncbi:MAG: RIP metalloprotease RseP [Flavobacterium sp.]|uniref:RIP metalloprotease RseP n=1 Tax=Flavobacterium sp. TaxID=239 RepID=UPI001210707A|nr:RIP metalloprotease RseP [Flavobacterium sp.]RZJ68491.1 MAG: RIP metalloprotease RseP [Flavobacterium sp.]